MCPAGVQVDCLFNKIGTVVLCVFALLDSTWQRCHITLFLVKKSNVGAESEH